MGVVEGLVEQLVALRHRQGMTQRELADASGLTQPVIAAYETRTREPGAGRLERLAEALGTRFVPAPVIDVDVIFAAHPGMRRESIRSLVLHHQIVVELLTKPERTRSIAARNLRKLHRGDVHGLLRHRYDEWEQLLAGDTATLTARMLDPSSDGADLRQRAPFAGVIDQQTRTRLLGRLAALQRERHADPEHTERTDDAHVVMPYQPMTLETLGVHLTEMQGTFSRQWRAVLEFLELFRHEVAAVQQQLINDEPAAVGDVRWDAFLAGLAEYVTQRDGLVLPEWTGATSRRLEQRWFLVSDSPTAQKRSISTSPEPFRSRGVYLEPHDLEVA
jgi:transcriptional regulator with XRE-family HTH domain